MRGRPALRRERGAERLDRPVGVGGAGGEGGQQPLRPLPGLVAAAVRAQRRELLVGDRARRQRAGLVGAQHVHVAQALDGVELLHQHVFAEQPDRAERVRERDAQHQAVGDERQDDGGHAHALHEGHVHEHVAHPHEGLEHDDHDEQDAHDLHHLPLQRGELALVGRRLGGELVGEAVETDAGGLVVAAARHAEAARHELVPGVLGHEVRLAGEQALVDLHAALADHGPVHDHLVARLEAQDVAEHDLRRVELHELPVAQHVRLGAQQDRHLVHHALGADLLEQADDGVGGDDEDDGERVQRLAQDQEQDAEEVEEVVDEVEDVVADDPPVGAAGADLDVVALARGAPPVGLSGAEAGERRRVCLQCAHQGDRTRSAARRASSPPARTGPDVKHSPSRSGEGGALRVESSGAGPPSARDSRRLLLARRVQPENPRGPGFMSAPIMPGARSRGAPCPGRRRRTPAVERRRDDRAGRRRRSSAARVFTGPPCARGPDLAGRVGSGGGARPARCEERRPAAALRLRLSAPAGERQADRNTTLAGRALHGHFAAVRLHELLDDGEADAGAAGLAGARLLAAPEPGEHARHVLRARCRCRCRAPRGRRGRRRGAR